MSRPIRVLLVAVVALLAVGGYWKLALAPKRVQAADLAHQVATQEAQLAQTQSLIKSYQGAQGAYKANVATVVRLGKALPADDDTRSLVVQLDAAAKRSGVDFDNIDVSGGSGASSAASSPASSTTAAVPGAVSAGAYQVMPFTFSFSGDFATLDNFLSRIGRFVTVKGDKVLVQGRLMRLDSITLAPASTGWPGLTAQINASSYLASDATAAAPAPSASSSTTTTAPPTTGTAADQSGNVE